MRTPAARAAGAALVLAAYYWILLANPFVQQSSAADLRLQADIDASRRLFDEKKFADALAPTERLTKQLSTQAVYFDRLARIFRELKRPADEARAWEQVMAVSATPIDACPDVAEAYQRAGLTAEALTALERCAGLPPRNPDFLLLLGQELLKADRKAEARQAFERGLEVDRTYPDLHLLVGVRQFEDGDKAAARKSFEEFVRLAPARKPEAEVWLKRTESIR